MTHRLIKSPADHAAALARIDELWSAAPGTPEADEMELLVHLVEVYEEANHPIPMPDPISALRFRMEQQGLKAADLTRYLGPKGRVSEVLNRKRPLTLAMIRRLHEGLGIPLAVLVAKAPLPRPRKAAAGKGGRRAAP